MQATPSFEESPPSSAHRGMVPLPASAAQLRHAKPEADRPSEAPAASLPDRAGQVVCLPRSQAALKRGVWCCCCCPGCSRLIGQAPSPESDTQEADEVTFTLSEFLSFGPGNLICSCLAGGWKDAKSFRAAAEKKRVA